MPDPKAQFTARAGQAIQKTVELVLRDPIDMRGRRGPIYTGGDSPLPILIVTGTNATAGNGSGGALGIGYYACLLIGPPATTPIDPTITLTASAIGSITTTACYAQNPYETGTSRYIDTSGATVPQTFAAVLRGVSSAATGSLPVYMLISPIQAVPGCTAGA